VKAVRKVGTRLLAVSGLQDMSWDFFVIESPIPNAFVTPNGKVVVFTGILPIMRDEEGMATVLGHEIAHVVARHAAEQLSRSIFLPLIQILFTVFLGSPDLATALSTLLVRLRYSRICETEADYIGLLLMARACYNPEKAIDVWRRFERVTPHQIEYLSTHPSPKNRKLNLQKWMPEALREREQSHCKPIKTSYRRKWEPKTSEQKPAVAPIPIVVIQPPEEPDDILKELFGDDDDDIF
jgi:Zn-dependent protease with chaperone function